MKNFYINIVIYILWMLPTGVFGQTVGTIMNSNSAQDGYTLLAPNSDTTVYLIDNCGYVVHKWLTNTLPGVSTYLLEDGSLLRTGRSGNNPTFNQGGVGGKVLRYDWNGTLSWDFTFSTVNYCQHHDVEYLSNGNILVLATELKTLADCIAAGRDPSLLNQGELWPEFVVEIQPVGSDSGIVVWEWHAWDHLVQDFDNTKANYQTSASAPELFDLNYQNNLSADWMHANSIDYNPQLDQILISSKTWSELWVVDHSTSSAEAAAHTGGNRGKGGDLLYRWGNPATCGAVGTQQLDNPHDIHWIEQGKKDAGKIMIFNNGKDRGWSSIDVIEPPVDSFGNYILTTNYFGPASLFWTYEDPIPSNFYASRISGAERMKNGNTRICSGVSGHLFEIDSAKNIVWEYINPVSNVGILSQGQVPTPVSNAVFRAYQYPVDYPAFIGKNLTPTIPIELNPNTSHCTIYSDIHNIVDQKKLEGTLFPNPVVDILNLEMNSIYENTKVQIHNLLGQKLLEQPIDGAHTVQLDLSNYRTGIYIITVFNEFEQLSFQEIVKKE